MAGQARKVPRRSRYVGEGHARRSKSAESLQDVRKRSRTANGSKR